MNEITDNEALVELAAEAAHTANKEYCESVGDDSQVGWGDAEDWQRQSSISGVKFLIANPTAQSSALHENWMREKVQDGWTYGPVKNVDDKLHPCMLPFNQLPKEQQKKDEIFFHAVTSVLAGAVVEPVVEPVVEKTVDNVTAKDVSEKVTGSPTPATETKTAK